MILAAILPLGALIPIAVLVQSDRHITLSVLFAPVGAGIRWIVCTRNPVWIPTFPLGTFIVNMTGTVLISCLNAASMRGNPASLACDFILALQTGFCGCLTTVSSFQHELYTLKLKHSYIYGTATIIVAQLLLLVINGSVSWTATAPPVAACQS